MTVFICISVFPWGFMFYHNCREHVSLWFSCKSCKCKNIRTFNRFLQYVSESFALSQFKFLKLVIFSITQWIFQFSFIFKQRRTSSRKTTSSWWRLSGPRSGSWLLASHLRLWIETHNILMINQIWSFPFWCCSVRWCWEPTEGKTTT